MQEAEDSISDSALTSGSSRPASWKHDGGQSLARPRMMEPLVPLVLVLALRELELEPPQQLQMLRPPPEHCWWTAQEQESDPPD